MVWGCVVSEHSRGVTARVRVSLREFSSDSSPTCIGIESDTPDPSKYSAETGRGVLGAGGRDVQGGGKGKAVSE